MIQRYRSVQKTSLEEYIGDILDTTPCSLCRYHATCAFRNPEEDPQHTEDHDPCPAFDSTIDDIRDSFLKTQTVDSA